MSKPKYTEDMIIHTKQNTSNTNDEVKSPKSISNKYNNMNSSKGYLQKDKEKEFQIINTEYQNFEYENDLAQEEHYNHVRNVKKLSEANEAYAMLLNEDIELLHEKISKIQAKHHSDYLSTFNVFMETVKKDIKEKIEKMNQVEKEKEKNNNIQLVIAERDMFRQEAIRLNLLTKNLHEQIELLRREKKFMMTEMENIIKKWKTSEENNRKLIIELNNSVLLNNEVQKKLETKKEEVYSRDFLLTTTKNIKGSTKNLNSIANTNINNKLPNVKDNKYFIPSKDNFNNTINSTNEDYLTILEKSSPENIKFDEFKKVRTIKFLYLIFN